jgi:hypothetical protein
MSRPDQGVAGAPITISGAHLPANAKVELTWSTANVTWLLDPEADTVNYLGRDETKFAVVLDRTTTDKNGYFRVALRAPQDWGGVHDIYAVIGGLEDAHGGFITRRSLTVTPRSGPSGPRSPSPTAAWAPASTKAAGRCFTTTASWAR